MLKCSTSLWSVDLANLAAETKPVEAHSDRFHIDVADGIYVPTLLFFPDLVKAMRPHTIERLISEKIRTVAADRCIGLRADFASRPL